MPIRPYLTNGAFTPEDVNVITTAFEDCLLSLGLTKRSDPTVLTVAKMVVALAKRGTTTPTQLRDQVLQSFKNGIVA